MATAAQVLVVFDYDWSLVNENSDTFVFKQLHAPLLDTLRERLALRQQQQQEVSWTALMDELLHELSQQQPLVTPKVIRATLAQIPILDRMLDAVRLAVDTHGADLKIVSDANTVYIQSMLEHHALASHVSEVFTNPGFFEGVNSSRLRVQPYHALHLVPHGCPNCPANMCKGAILDQIRRGNPGYTHVLYIGDGGGDFCPSTRLTAQDVVFARGDDADGKAYGLLKKILAKREKVQAKVVPWSSGEDIYSHFDAFFQGLKQQQPVSQ
ncbi:Pyridoxal phosphate phosphatase [Globisporangium polare]